MILNEEESEIAKKAEKAPRFEPFTNRTPLTPLVCENIHDELNEYINRPMVTRSNDYESAYSNFSYVDLSYVYTMDFNASSIDFDQGKGQLKKAAVHTNNDICSPCGVSCERMSNSQ